MNHANGLDARQHRGFDQAGRQGFEPWVEHYPYNHLAGGPDRPLRHLPAKAASC